MYASLKSLLSLFVSCRTVIVKNVVYRTVIKRAVYFLFIQVVYFSLDSGLDVLCGSVLYKCRFYSHTPPQDFEVFGGLDKVRIGEENQAYRGIAVSRLRVERLRYGRYSSLAEAGYEVLDGCKCLTKTPP